MSRPHLLCVATSFALVLPATASAYCWKRTGGQSQTESDPCPSAGEPLHQARRCMAFQLSSYGLAEFLDPASGMTLTENGARDAIQVAFRQWTSLSCIRDQGWSVQIAAGTNDESRFAFSNDGPNVSSIIFQREWEEIDGSHTPSTFALTKWWFIPSSGEIVDVDIDINQPGFIFRNCETEICENFDVDLQNVMTHEAGHAFGLSHSTVQRATMYPDSAPRNMSLRSLESDDEAGFCALYAAHPIGDETCSYDWPDNTPPEGGCAIAQSIQNEKSSLNWAAFFVIACSLARRRR